MNSAVRWQQSQVASQGTYADRWCDEMSRYGVGGLVRRPSRASSGVVFLTRSLCLVSHVELSFTRLQRAMLIAWNEQGPSCKQAMLLAQARVDSNVMKCFVLIP